MAVLFEFDPTSEDAANSPLEIWGTATYAVTSFSAPAPQLDVQYAGSVDTEGMVPSSWKDQNRQLSLTVEVMSAAGLRALQAKAAKIRRERGTAKMTFPSAEVVIFDLLFAETFDPELDQKYFINSGAYCTVTLTLSAKPYGRGPTVTLADHVETTLPAIVFTETGIKGDCYGLGRLVVDNDDASNDQQWLVWGIQSRYYDSATSAALLYEAEGRTAMGGSAIAAGPSGASGAGSNVMRNTSLATTYQAILSTQATGGGAHLSHVGTFRVFARCQAPTTNTGTVSVALGWGDGSFLRYSENDATDLDGSWEGTWRIVDLGLVSPRKVTAGTQRWEGRVLAKSTVGGDDLDIDWLFLVPVDEGSGEVLTPLRIPTPTAFTARDEFDQSAGNLAAKTLPIGGTWTGAGDATDFTVDSSTASATRTSSNVSDRFQRAGTGTLTGVIVRADMTLPLGRQGGLFARYTDTSNHILAYIAGAATPVTLTLHKRVAGIVTILKQALIPYATTYRMELVAYPTGDVGVFINGVLISRAYDSAIATGGTLATGGYGLYDSNSPFPVAAGFYDNFAVFPPLTDAAMFASQSIEIRNDQIIHKDSGGTLWERPSAYEGDYLLIPPAGAEARTARMIVKGSRFVPGSGPDTGTDDISARLTYTPRYLVVPEP